MLIGFILTRVAVKKLTGTKIEKRIGIYIATFALTATVLEILNIWLSVQQWYLVVLLFPIAYVFFWGCLWGFREMHLADIHYMLDLVNLRKMGGYVSDELHGKN